MFDATLNLLGADDSHYKADIATTTTGDWVQVEKNRTYRAWLRVGGDVTGTNPTMDVVLQYCNDAGSSDGTAATFVQVTDEQVGYIASTVAKPEVPGEDPLMVTFLSPDRYLRAVATIGGTSTPTFREVSIELTPLQVASPVRSGQ